MNNPTHEQQELRADALVHAPVGRDALVEKLRDEWLISGGVERKEWQPTVKI